MIIRDRPHAFELLFLMKGSIIPQIWPQILFVATLSLAITLMEIQASMHLQSISVLPFSLIGIALSIFSGFRNSASYERWWEARKIIGQLVIDVRNLSSSAISYIEGDQSAAIARNSMAFAHALRGHLRGDDGLETAKKLAVVPETMNLASSQNIPNALLTIMRRQVGDALKSGNIPAQMAQSLEEKISSLSSVLAGAERIKSTPMPYAYSLLLHRTAYLFCFLLPFGLADNAGYWTPLVASIVAYTFFGLDALGDELASPFDAVPNGLPLAAICRTIDINILELLGEKDLPPQLLPVKHLLL
jgi:putative membrane protein